ncbi:MAG: thioredoxin domain-containing protein [Deltaproteobacteria bacterium]|jgi:protein-disulfide isomerase|nr:thioredoxin domain-containing protein [Deltaproteobacteria bacterium]
MTTRHLFVVVLMIGILLWQPCSAEIDLEILRNIAVDGTPVDVVVSEDGYWIYVLTDTARLLVYSREGALQGTVAVPNGSRRIAGSPEEDVLFVTNSDERTVQAIRVNLQHEFTSAQSPTKGPSDAPVTLTLFTDFECSYCARLAPVLDQVHQQYPEKVRIVFKNFPLRMHRFAVPAALAGLAANDQGQFWPFHDRLFENYNQLNAQKIEAIREELGLDAERFQARMNDPALKDLIRRDLEEGNAAGVRGTPTVFINGKKMRSRLTLDGFQEAIDGALEEAGKTATN